MRNRRSAAFRSHIANQIQNLRMFTGHSLQKNVNDPVTPETVFGRDLAFRRRIVSFDRRVRLP